jgi:hypothetical protein
MKQVEYMGLHTMEQGSSTRDMWPARWFVLSARASVHSQDPCKQVEAACHIERILLKLPTKCSV